MTISEKLCEDLNRIYFLSDFVFQKLFIKDEKGQKEICDGFVEMKDCYIIFQIKERNKQEDTLEDEEKWLKRTVYHDAVKQVRDTFDIIKNNDIIVEDCRGKSVVIDHEKEIIPVIIFKSKYIKEYKKIYYSKTLKKNINVFSWDDYQLMIKEVVVPVDILNYLSLRKECFLRFDKGLIINDLDENKVVLANIENENDFIDFYLTEENFDQSIKEEKIGVFHNIVSNFYVNLVEHNDQYKEILFRLMLLSRRSVIKFVERWEQIWADAKEGLINFQYRVVLRYGEKTVGILFSSNRHDSIQGSNDYCSSILNLFKQRYYLDEAMMLVAYNEGNGNIFVNWLLDRDKFVLDQELQEQLSKNNPWP